MYRHSEFDGWLSDGDGGCDGWGHDTRQPSTRRWWGVDRKGGRSLSRSQRDREINEIIFCCEPPSVTPDDFDNGANGGWTWVGKLFDNSYEIAGERAPRVRDLEQINIPGLMTANMQLRKHWGSDNIRYVWHGTSDSAADSIAVQGFDVGLCRKCDDDGRSMRRVWFHEDARFAAMFAASAKHRDWRGNNRRPPRTFVMILALVATPTETSPHTWIFRNDQAVPVFKVTYAYPRRRRQR
jgi:hypothetical protein